MSNGQLKDNGEGGFIGNIETMDVSIQVVLKPYTARTPDGPVFEIFAKAKSGNLVRIGAAWEKAAKESGEVFYSLTLDDPSFPCPLNVTAFKGASYGVFDVVWKRPRQQQAA